MTEILADDGNISRGVVSFLVAFLQIWLYLTKLVVIEYLKIFIRLFQTFKELSLRGVVIFLFMICLSIDAIGYSLEKCSLVLVHRLVVFFVYILNDLFPVFLQSARANAHLRPEMRFP